MRDADYLDGGSLLARASVLRGVGGFDEQLFMYAEDCDLSVRSGPMEDPDAPNGGSYIADLFPDQTGEINIRFLMNDSDSILIRRQPGVTVGM